jgi:hypothetical protein
MRKRRWGRFWQKGLLVGTDMALGHTVPADKFSYLGPILINVLDPDPDPRSKVTLGNGKKQRNLLKSWMFRAGGFIQAKII